jgi:hypothetical protein
LIARWRRCGFGFPEEDGGPAGCARVGAIVCGRGVVKDAFGVSTTAGDNLGGVPEFKIETVLELMYHFIEFDFVFGSLILCHETHKNFRHGESQDPKKANCNHEFNECQA